VVRRPRTNTPLQALALLNDLQMVDASKAFAQRMLVHGGKETNARINYGFRLATARKPDAEELKVLRAVLDHQLAEYRANKGEAEKLIEAGSYRPDKDLDPAELAAWTTLANLLLNLDETITKN
jgi:hypothetical protein